MGPLRWLLSLLIVAGVGAGCVGRGPDHQTPTATPDPTSPPVRAPAPAAGNPFGVSMAAGVNDPAIPAALGLAARAGIGWVRIAGTEWSRVEPRKGEFDWWAADRIIDLARGLGFEILAPLAYTPQWASSAPTGLPAGLRTRAPPRDLRDWEAYVAATVSRYRDRVHYWQVWNEPDLAGFWAGTPHEYAELLAA